MKYVCKNCFADEELKGFILSQNKIGDCSFCDSRNVEIIAIEELLEFFKELNSNFKIDSNGHSLLSLIQGNWNLFSKLEFGKKILNYVLLEIGSNFINSEVLANFNDDIIENVNYWEKLKHQLKWERRYLANIGYLTEILGWDGFFESKVKINKFDIFFRARLHNYANEEIFSKENMYCPPAEIATPGRANPLGIPYLYLSDNQKTILYEIRTSYLDEITIATFILKNDIQEDILISDFTEIPSLYIPGAVNSRIKSTLLKQLISKDLSKPMRRYDSDIDYIPTQFICEFIRVFTNVQGIKFRSSLHQDGNNLVIFNQNIMDCIDVKKVKITKVELESENL